MPAISQKYFASRPLYNITINEEQRKLILKCLEEVDWQDTNENIDAEDINEIRNLLDMLKTADENPHYGLHPAPAVNSLCV